MQAMAGPYTQTRLQNRVKTSSTREIILTTFKDEIELLYVFLGWQLKDVMERISKEHNINLS